MRAHVDSCGKISSAQMEKAMHNLGIDDYSAPSTEKVSDYALAQGVWEG
jgi:hypothetical protein